GRLAGPERRLGRRVGVVEADRMGRRARRAHRLAQAGGGSRAAPPRRDADRADAHRDRAGRDRGAGADAAARRAGVHAPMSRDRSRFEDGRFEMPTSTRRQFLKGALASSGALLAPRITFAATASDARFVWVLLRGGLDGLAAVPPYADPDYARLRRELAIPAPGTDGGALDLDGFFGLHPSLPFLHEAFADGDLAVLHAVATPYRDRSHFDAQDVLESGVAQPHASDSGWLNRALASLPAATSPEGARAVALGHNVPLVLRGPAEVTSWTPSRLPPLDDDTLERIADLYSDDALLSRRLADALATQARAAESMEDEREIRGRGNAQLVDAVRTAASFLEEDGAASVAVLDTSGWDTHANEGAAQGQLALRLAALDSALRELKRRLGPS